MPERPVARPKAATPAIEPEQAKSEAPAEQVAPSDLPDLEFPGGKVSPTAVGEAVKPQAPAVETDELDFTSSEFERGFSDSNVMSIDVEHGDDPMQADIEQVAVLYANGQDAAARSLLDIYVRSYFGQDGLRFWRMYFDLLQQTGDRAGFDKLCLDFSEACEMSPPTWAEQRKEAAPRQSAGVATLTLQGVMTAEDAPQLQPLTAAVDKKQPLRLDCGKLIGCDDEIAGQLAQALQRARQRNVVIGIDGVEALLTRLQGRLLVGQPEHLPAWTLLLELLQRHGTQDEFEEKAVDYAITFELSPPSWETTKAAALPPAQPAAQGDPAHHLSGELRNCRFAELPDLLGASEFPVLDFSAVRRLDFFSAGQLVNCLAPLKAAGQEVVIRSPNHLVAELMAVVGLNKFARIIVPKS